MSIAATIAALEASGRLRRFKPRGRHPAKRRLYLTQSAQAELHNSQSAVNILVGRGFIEASLMRWVSGGRIHAERRRCRFLCRLEPPPPEIWDIRVTEPVVQARLFCRFADRDTLILTGLHTRGLLGKKGSSMWQNAMTDCEQSWKDLFGITAPFQGVSIHEYVSENCDDYSI
jgi:hypothetical protein